MPDLLAHARDCIERCRALALHTEEPGHITRTFLSEPMRAVHEDLRAWMLECGVAAYIDPAGNLRGRYTSDAPGAPVLFIGSHLDTVPHAGAFDGILGVVVAIKLIELVRPRRFAFDIEVPGFSEEEGVRFGLPFIGSLAFIGELDLKSKPEVKEAIRAYGLNPDDIDAAAFKGTPLGYLEFHIEQGPLLERLNIPVAAVSSIAGQSRATVIFEGHAGHAGTTPMNMRRDALAGAADWIVTVESLARSFPNMVATVGRIEATPGVGNVIPGSVTLSLDVRHAEDFDRHACVARILQAADEIAAMRKLSVTHRIAMDQPAVEMNARLTDMLVSHRVTSGAGHDAMVAARRMPAAMLFVRSPGGVSHHPDETVLAEDVAAALQCGLRFFDMLNEAQA